MNRRANNLSHLNNLARVFTLAFDLDPKNLPENFVHPRDFVPGLVFLDDGELWALSQVRGDLEECPLLELIRLDHPRAQETDYARRITLERYQTWEPVGWIDPKLLRHAPDKLCSPVTDPQGEEDQP